MYFDKFCIDKIIDEEKCVTRRLIKPGGRRPAIPGTIHKLKKDRTKKIYGYIFINSCSQTQIKDIDDKEAKLEGFDSRQEYIDYFMDINNIDILNDHDWVWRVRFTYIGQLVTKEIGGVMCSYYEKGSWRTFSDYVE